MESWIYEPELYHYGVKGMKWGVRRAKDPLPTSDIRRKVDSTKAVYKQAKKDYNKSFNKAYNYSELHPITQHVSKKVNAEATKRWDDAYDKASNLRSTKQAYKQAKSERKQKLADARREVNKNSNFGDKLLYNDATRNKAAKYMVDNNMSMKDARDKSNAEARRNTAIILGAYGAVAVASIYANKKR